MEKLLLVLMASLLFTGCAHFTPLAQQRELDPSKIYWVNYDASRRGAFIVPVDKKFVSCAEPAPDIGFNLTNGLKGNFSFPNGTNISEVDGSSNVITQELSGRENVVLLAREAMFRLCERGANSGLSEESYQALYNNVFNKVAEIAQAQAQKAKSDAVKAIEIKESNILKLEQLKRLSLAPDLNLEKK